MSKAHIDYWKTRVYKANQKGDESNWFVQLKARGERHSWSLDTPNKDLAARLARDVYEFIRVNGWEAARAKFRPQQCVRKASEVTVGEFIEEVKRTTDLAPKTLEDYSRAFRKIVADICGADTGTNKYDAHAGGYQAWLGKIYKVKLAR